MVSFTLRPLYSQGKSPRYQFDRRLGGPQSWSGHGVHEKNSQSSPGIEPWPSDRVARSQSLYRLSYPGSSMGTAVNDKDKVKLSPCLTKYHAMKTYPVLKQAPRQEEVWSGGMVPHILNLDTKWSWVVSSTPLPLYPRGKRPRFPLDRRLGGPQCRSGSGGEEKNLYSCRESNPGRPAHSLVTIQTELLNCEIIRFERKIGISLRHFIS
jgi:hypothetical protein